MSFSNYLKGKGYAENTIKSYLFAVEQFNQTYSQLSNDSLRAYKLELIENCKPRTVNLRISAMNCFIKSIGSECTKLQTVKYQQQTFLENVISFPDYEYLKSCLLKDNKIMWYFVVRFLGSTGVRISELLKIKIEHVNVGYVDLYTKGGKIRRIYIPINLQSDAKRWLTTESRETGYIFINYGGRQLTAKGISSQLKRIAKIYGLDPSVVHPHSFRHMFAKTFIDRHNDIALLADLMGHESIETTRIYLRKTSNEQQNIVNMTVDW